MSSRDMRGSRSELGNGCKNRRGKLPDGREDTRGGGASGVGEIEIEGRGGGGDMAKGGGESVSVRVSWSWLVRKDNTRERLLSGRPLRASWNAEAVGEAWE